MYGMAKVLAKIFEPLVVKSPPHHIHSNQDLFTSIPEEPALGIIKGLLEKHNTLKESTILPVKDIILLFGFGLHNTYFFFQGQFYKQVKGAAMGFPVSPRVANLYMEYFKQKALYCHPPP